MGLKPPTRRDFLIAGSSVAIAAATPVMGAEPPQNDDSSQVAPVFRQELLRTGPQRTFTGDRTTQIALPIGGIGAGSICMNGYGGLQDFSIRTRPETSALPAGFTANSPEA
ncbi:MAG TPA: hypothetical protein VHA37_03580, partial [Candidatus Saccharimonadales bacterium]|nr:hypothetical protein [Candidatus Saccharimonadales bacterium]